MGIFNFDTDELRDFIYGRGITVLREHGKDINQENVDIFVMGVAEGIKWISDEVDKRGLT